MPFARAFAWENIKAGNSVASAAILVSQAAYLGLKAMRRVRWRDFISPGDIRLHGTDPDLDIL